MPEPRSLKYYREVIGDAERLQLGPFPQQLTVGDAKFIAALAASIDALTVPHATISVICSHVEARALAGVVLPKECTSWTLEDRRPLGLRILRIGSITATNRTRSEHALAELLTLAWARGRIMVSVGERYVSNENAVRTLNDGVDPVPFFPPGAQTVLVSFFHGAWLAIYRPVNKGDTIQKVVETARLVGLPVEPSNTPF